MLREYRHAATCYKHTAIQLLVARISQYEYLYPAEPKKAQWSPPYFPTLAVWLLDFKVDVVLARLEADVSDQPPSIPAVPNHQVSLQCPTAEYPYTAQPQSIPAVLNHYVSLQCPTAKYPCSAQLQSIPAVSNHQISLQGPTEKYPCSAQAQSVPGVPNSKVSIFLQRICSAARKTVEGGQGTVTLVVQ